jgi:hypothetical protein
MPKHRRAKPYKSQITDPNKEPKACLGCFVWEGFGAGPAYPKGLVQLSVGDFDESSPLRAATRQLSPDQFFGESWT